MTKVCLSLFLTLGLSFSIYGQNYWDFQKCIDYAMEHNISVRQSEYGIERAEINYNESRLSLLPNLNAQASHGYNFGQRIDPFTNEFATSRVRTDNIFMSSSLDLFNGFSKLNRIKMNEESVMASQYDLNKIQNDISLQLCLAYLQILLNEENVAIAQEQVELSQIQVDRMQTLVDAGQEPMGSLYETQSQLAQEQLNLTNAQNSVVLSTLNLTQILQLPADQMQGFSIVKPILTDDGLELLKRTPMEIYGVAKQSMPEILAAEHRRSSAEYGLASAKGSLYPNLSISGSIGSGYSGANNVPVGDGTTITPQIGVVGGTDVPVFSVVPQTFYDQFDTKSFSDQLSDNFNQNFQFSLVIPIFNGFSANANVRRARISQMEAELNYLQISDQLRFDIEQSYADAKAAMNSYISAEKAVLALEESFKYAETRFDAGAMNAVDFNTIKTNYTNAQSNLVNAKYDFVFRTKILDFYVGNPITL
jgi:outer membrane protein